MSAQAFLLAARASGHTPHYDASRDEWRCGQCGANLSLWNDGLVIPPCTAPDAVAPSKPHLIGIMPRWLHNEHRAADILNAMLRYLDAGTPIPRAWLDELVEYVHAVPRVE